MQYFYYLIRTGSLGNMENKVEKVGYDRMFCKKENNKISIDGKM